MNTTARLAKTERLTTLEILVHQNEVEKRELYLGRGCGSMFDYCVTQLGYSRSAAGRLPGPGDAGPCGSAGIGGFIRSGVRGTGVCR
ncbi:MAG: hypothetical protein P8181_09935 [bacterium]